MLALPCTANGATERLLYSPFEADGQTRSGLNVVDRDGECFFTSLKAASGYRCVTGYLLRDPCYSDPRVNPVESFSAVVCAQSPWGTTVVRIALSEALPKREPSPLSSPSFWAIELESGARCTFTSGATNAVRGYRLHYGRSNNRVLFGAPRTSTSTWRIRYASDGSGRGMKLAASNGRGVGTRCLQSPGDVHAGCAKPGHTSVSGDLQVDAVRTPLRARRSLRRSRLRAYGRRSSMSASHCPWRR
jgi:hypothetical protein